MKNLIFKFEKLMWLNSEVCLYEVTEREDKSYYILKDGNIEKVYSDWASAKREFMNKILDYMPLL